MKTKNDPRHIRRVQTVKELFASSFTPQPTYSDRTKEIFGHKEEIDAYITKGAPQWPVDKIAMMDLAILRNAVYELKFSPETPPKVVIDEAVEIAKEYGKENSSKFVNGVLGTILQWIQKIS
jgi:N utilization substance protein B